MNRRQRKARKQRASEHIREMAVRKASDSPPVRKRKQPKKRKDS